MICTNCRLNVNDVPREYTVDKSSSNQTSDGYRRRQVLRKKLRNKYCNLGFFKILFFSFIKLCDITQRRGASVYVRDYLLWQITPHLAW